jgi:DNA-binding NarL/FixJ family response regulator
MLPGEIADRPHIATQRSLLRLIPSSMWADPFARWDYSVSVFRGAVENYRRALQMQQRRTASRTSVTRSLVVATAGMPPQPLAHGRCVLTRRETEVASLIAQGLSNQRLAARLVIEQGTVANHVAHILRKLDVANRTQIAAWYLATYPPRQ